MHCMEQCIEGGGKAREITWSGKRRPVVKGKIRFCAVSRAISRHVFSAAIAVIHFFDLPTALDHVAVSHQANPNKLAGDR